MRAHTVIVGGGVMGTAIAMYLAPRLDPLEEPVLLLERRTLGAGSSGRSGAILRQHYATPQIASMARDSLRVWSRFATATGYSVGFQRTGVLTLAGPQRPAERDRVRANVEMLRGLGIETWIVEGAELARLAPGIALAEGTLAAYEPDGGHVDPQRALEAFAALARFRGATTRTGCEVTGFDVQGGALRAVLTSNGPIACRRAVVAAGPWTRRLLSQVGIDLPLTVVRPLQQFLAMPPALLGTGAAGREAEEHETSLTDTALRTAGAREELPPAAHPVLLDLEHGFYARCEPGAQRTRVGEMDCSNMVVLDDPDQIDETRDPAFAARARAMLAARMPVYAKQAEREQMAAWYTLTPDTQAVIGPLPEVEGLWVVGGFSGHGFKLAPSIGEGVARSLCGEAAGTFDPDFFDPRRFAGAQTGALAAGRFGF
jgi:sarcosine oxidase, subunit beta